MDNERDTYYFYNEQVRQRHGKYIVRLTTYAAVEYAGDATHNEYDARRAAAEELGVATSSMLDWVDDDD